MNHAFLTKLYGLFCISHTLQTTMYGGLEERFLHGYGGEGAIAQA
jgi:hypothetical protein